MKQVYPTFIVNTNDASEHPFLVCVSDMDILTEGDTFADEIEMARDAIGTAGISMEYNKEQNIIINCWISLCINSKRLVLG